jgi:hypothetical protein
MNQKRVMNIVKFLMVVVLLNVGCGGHFKDNVQYDFKEIVGCWHLIDPVDEINYPVICFGQDSSVFFRSRGDTLYSFKLNAVDTHLHLKDPLGEVHTFPI